MFSDSKTLYQLKKNPGEYIRYLENKNRENSTIRQRRNHKKEREEGFSLMFNGANKHRSNSIQTITPARTRKKWGTIDQDIKIATEENLEVKIIDTQDLVRRINNLSHENQRYLLGVLSNLENNII